MDTINPHQLITQNTTTKRLLASCQFKYPNTSNTVEISKTTSQQSRMKPKTDKCLRIKYSLRTLWSALISKLRGIIYPTYQWCLRSWNKTSLMVLPSYKNIKYRICKRSSIGVVMVYPMIEVDREVVIEEAMEAKLEVTNLVSPRI